MRGYSSQSGREAHTHWLICPTINAKTAMMTAHATAIQALLVNESP